MKDRADKLLAGSQDIKDRRKEHFDQLYNVNITTDSTILLELLTEGEVDRQLDNTLDPLR